MQDDSRRSVREDTPIDMMWGDVEIKSFMRPWYSGDGLVKLPISYEGLSDLEQGSLEDPQTITRGYDVDVYPTLSPLGYQNGVFFYPACNLPWQQLKNAADATKLVNAWFKAIPEDGSGLVRPHALPSTSQIEAVSQHQYGVRSSIFHVME